MSELVNEIVLRPRFDIRLYTDPDTLKAAFDIQPKDPFLLKRIDEHVYIRFKKEKTTFWSPQLHLEISSFSPKKSTIHGVFGPNPTLWTFFMFLHFGVATTFIIMGIFAYSKHSLGHDITLWLIGMGFLVVIWFTLYAFGRLGKAKGKPQMQQLRKYADELFIGIQKEHGQ
ncbi:GTP-binding protein [Muricauda sp. SCSIO 64092]|uniref:GTP-binding protein n=1 Tax=Allomuricauda sp. SCSIO 64092 TaxID=2908842 RepID=UPI001FF69C77|nr:GTP-binding protein [Muricauda sp. SCSIO 64092]UOY05047.1 GTP-binding protein [Muricauda sp. SCSIO 64092]